MLEKNAGVDHAALPGIAAPSPSALLASRWGVLVASVLAGALLTALWSYEFVDRVIGGTVADALMGHDVAAEPIGSTATGLLFALVSGLAGTFTACNVCVFSGVTCITSGTKGGGRTSGLLIMALTALGVAATYGAVIAAAGAGLPQISDAKLDGTGLPVRLVQATIVFTTIGAAFALWGFALLGLVPALHRRVVGLPSWATAVAFGILVGAFLIGRPFPMFRRMFAHAVEMGDPLYGAFVFGLQMLGNLLVMAVLFLLLVHGTQGRFERWVHATPNRPHSVAAASLLFAGTFLITYWGMRVPSRFGIGWWPEINF
jgi:hypothetical protein